MILPITGKVGDFLNGEVVTGQTSGATGIAVTKNEPANLLCCGQTNPSAIVLPYFSAKYYHYESYDPETEICLNDVQGTFQDEEQVVGETSGAYAYYWEKPPGPVTVPDILFSPCNIYKNGWDFDSYENAWDDYQNDPGWQCWGEACRSVKWRIWIDVPTPYRVDAGKCFLKFNTTNSHPAISSALLRIYLHYCGGDDAVNGNDIHLNTYVQDFGEEVDVGDWLGGVLADNTIVINESDADTWIEIPLSPDEVNIGGYSKYKLSIKEIDDDVYTGPLYKRITISDAELKLIY